MRHRGAIVLVVIGVVAIFCLSGSPQAVFAHCDTLDGPVVTDARVALEKGDVAPVLKWVKHEYESEVRDAFNKTLAVGRQSFEAKELADMYFFETVVRLHRAGEGEAYTGLKSSGSVDPAIAAADKALESGSVEVLVADITSEVAAATRERFEAVLEARKHESESIEAGRKYVAAYVEYVHFVEAAHQTLLSAHGHGEGEKDAEEHN